MNMLEKTSLDAFLGRFYNFYDGIVRKVEVDFEATPATCTVVVETQDIESDSGWSRVLFRVTGCSQFRMEVGRTTFEVLSSGIQIGWRKGLVFLFLDAYPDDEGLPDLDTNRAFIAGQGLDWSVTPLSSDK